MKGERPSIRYHRLVIGGIHDRFGSTREVYSYYGAHKLGNARKVGTGIEEEFVFSVRAPSRPHLYPAVWGPNRRGFGVLN